MEEFIKADVFFYITSIAVVILTILLAIGLIYVILILRSAKRFVEIVKEEGQEVVEDIREFRARLKTEEGIVRKLPAFLTFIKKISGIGKKRTRKGTDSD